MVRYKKKILLLLIIGTMIFFPHGVKAKTQCVYNWKNTTYSIDGSTVTTKVVLETEEDNNKLTKATMSIRNDPVKIATDYIALNNGKCPTISVYDPLGFVDGILSDVKIFEGKEQCKNWALTDDKDCSDNLSGTINTKGTSTSNETGTAIQFKLSNSSDSACEYAENAPSNPSNATITVKKKGSNSANGSCNVPLTSSCSLKINDAKKTFYNSNSFSCPLYVYTNSKVSGGNNVQNITLTIVEQGTSADEDRKGKDYQTVQSNATLEGLNQTTSCNAIFSMKEGDFGWLIQKILDYIKVAGPILVVLLSAIDFIKAIASSEEDAYKKAQSKLIIRLIAALALFLIPTIVSLLLQLINGIADPTCGFH